LKDRLIFNKSSLEVELKDLVVLVAIVFELALGTLGKVISEKETDAPEKKDDY